MSILSLHVIVAIEEAHRYPQIHICIPLKEGNFISESVV